MSIIEMFYPRVGKIVLALLLVALFLPFLRIAGPGEIRNADRDASALSFILVPGNQILSIDWQMFYIGLAVSYGVSCVISSFTVKVGESG